MALDRSYDDADGPGEARPELHLHQDRSGGEAHAAHRAPAETRSRAEYYEALRAADSGSDAGDEIKPEATDTKRGKSGWDAIEEERRPAPDAFHVTPERTKHILDGDGPNKGGGHRHGTGKPDKTEFPQVWADKHIMRNVVDVARRPDSSPEYQQFNGRWLLYGTREHVKVFVIVLRDGEVWTAWPEEGGPGVVRNPKKGQETS